jgi:hypothetical protein
MRIKRTRLYITGKNTVAAERMLINDHGLEVRCWSEVIREGRPEDKPGPGLFGDDHWPDWPQLVRKAAKKLAAGGDEDAAIRWRTVNGLPIRSPRRPDL